MITPILTTKLYIPPPQTHLVPRPRLIERLNQGVSSQFTLISAPPGFGKSTLLSDWIAGINSPVAKLSLDGNDNDPVRFLVYLITALQQIDYKIGRDTLEILQSMRDPGYEVILTGVINEIAEVEDPFTLILDDYHVITAPQVHDLVEFLIDNLPQPMHLIIATRSDPPFPLSRLRVLGRLSEIRQDELRFTPGETADFLNKILGLNLSLAQIQILDRRTEGWIAGLQLAGLSMKGRADHNNFVERFGGSHKLVFDYLVEEVFEGLTADLQHFLLQTSIFDQFNLPLCMTVTGQEEAAWLIHELESGNLFLLPLDDQREWYRYHHLFRDFLYTRLDKGDQCDLHRKAARWLISNEHPLQAVKHALASEDTETIVQVISQASVEAIKQAAFPTVLGWVDSLPDSVVCAHIELAVIKGLVIFLLRSAEEARPYVESAQSNLLPDTPTSIQGQYLYQKALLALCDDQLDLCVEYARKALNYLDDDQPVIRNLTLNLLGEILDVKGDAESAADFYQQAFDVGWQSGDRVGALVLFANLIMSLNELGRRDEAEEKCKQVADGVREQTSFSSPLLEAIYLPWSLLKYEANQLDTAREYAQRALTMLQAVNFLEGISLGQYILGQIYLAERKFDLVYTISDQGMKLARQMKKTDRVLWFSALQAQADLDRGNLPSAVRWVERTGLTHQDATNRWNEIVYFTYIRILLVQERFAEASTLLQSMKQTILSSGRNRKLITIEILYSLMFAAQNRAQEARPHILNAVTLAAPQDYARAFLNESKEILPLIIQVHAAAPVFVDDLVSVFQDPSASVLGFHGSYETLTEREQEVLNLVSKGLSNREIAAALYVSLGTVKKHLNNVFGKLDVKNRTQAVNRGKELGLFK